MPKRKLFSNEEGNALVEAAFIAPVLILLIAGAVDISSAFSRKIAIQQAATRSIELATASGYNGAAFAKLQSDAAAAAGVPEAQVTVDKWLECSGARQTSFDGICLTGFPARFAAVSIAGSYTPSFAFVLKYARSSGDGTLALSGYAAVRIQ